MEQKKQISSKEQDFISSFFDEAVDHTPASLYREIIGLERRYTGERHYASGGMKVINVCQDEATGRFLAKAVMKESGSETDTEKFLREARITASLQHPNILPVYDIGVDQFGRPFFTMKLIEGESLEALLADRKNGSDISLEYLIEIYIKVNEAIAYAHSRGVIHLDIKPANIQISDYGEVLVCDWGLARIIDEDWVDEKFEDYSLSELHDDHKTVDGYVKGTLGYLSPEQATPGAHRDQRSDIYALGALLYEILAWRKPIIGQSLKLVLKKTIEGRIKSPTEIGRQAPRSLEAVCMMALSTDPEDRYQSVQELIADVQAYTRGFATDAEEAGVKEQLGLFLRRNSKITVLSIFFILLSAAALFFFISSLRQGQAEARSERDKAVKALEQVKKEKEISSFYGEKFKKDLLRDAEKAYREGDYSQAQAYLKYLGDEGLGVFCRLMLIQGKLGKAGSALKAVKGEEYRTLKNVLNILRGKTYSSSKFNTLLQSLKGDPLVTPLFEKIAGGLPYDERYSMIRQIMKETDGLHPEYKFFVKKDKEGLDINLHDNAKVRSLQYLKFLGRIHSLDISSTAVTTLKELKSLPLTKLNINDTGVSDLSPLKGMSLNEISLIGTKVRDLTPLAGMASLKIFKAGKNFSRFELKKLPPAARVVLKNLPP